MMLFQVFFHNVVENIQNFDNEWDVWEENAEYTVMEVIPHGFTGKVSFFMYLLFIKYIQTFSECNEQCEQH